MFKSAFAPALFTLALAFASFVRLHAAAPEWQTPDGKKFRGDPSEVLGPFAVFRTSATSSRTVALNALKPEDCVRFHQALATPGERAATWAGATGALSRELRTHALRVQNGKLVPAALDASPEPKFFILLCGAQDDGATRRMARHFTPTFHRVQQVYPGEMAAVFCGLNAPAEKSRALAVSARMPWLVADATAQNAMPVLSRLTGFAGTAIVAVSRHGLPILSAEGNDEFAVGKFIDELANLLRALNSDNPSTWQARAHYLRTVRPVEFAAGQAAPLLIGHPFRIDSLRARGITQLDGRIEVGADGKSTAVIIAPTGGVTPTLAPAFGEAMKRYAYFLPAVENGRFIASSFDYQLVVPAVDSTYAANAAWLGNEITVELPIKQWLVLKTFNVDQQGNLEVSHVDENGVTILKPVVAAKKKEGVADLSSQKLAFADDFFNPEDAAKLAPTDKLKQRIFGEDYTWRIMKPDGPSLNLKEGRGREEYCYAYAWTEIEVPEDRLAWLGFGSDDGVKIWLNGEVLLEKWVQRSLMTDEDVLALHLKKGKNQLMLKVQNIWGEWSFACRLRVRVK